MNKLQRFAILNKVLLISLALLVVFAWFDATQIKTIHTLTDDNKWVAYNQYTVVSIAVLWILVLAAIAFTYYVFVKDKSEALGLFAAPVIMLAFGVEDVLFFIFSSEPMTACMSWFSTTPYLPIISNVSNLLFKETCVSPKGLIVTAIVGTIIAYFALKWLKKQKW